MSSIAAAIGLPEVDRSGSGWAAPTVVMAVPSLYALYASLKRGPVFLVVPITAIAVGMFAVMRSPGSEEERASRPTTAIALAAVSAVLSAFAL